MPDPASLAASAADILHLRATAAGVRLDQFLAAHGEEIGGLTRSALKKLITDRRVTVNGALVKPGYRLKEGEEIVVELPPPVAGELVPEAIDFPILYEDSAIIVLVKPPGLVVHPACGNPTGTLVHGLLYHCRDLAGVGGELRPGIVHRLDKDTSGVMVVAKDDASCRSLVDQFKAKEVQKAYVALLDGCPATGRGTIRSLIGRHPVHRKKMAVLERGGREAVTHWRARPLAAGFSLADITIDTGRTHQIRVHMAAAGTPVAGDALYGRRNPRYRELGIGRQCLHAARLAFHHPVDGRPMEFAAPLWPDMAHTLKLLEGERD